MFALLTAIRFFGEQIKEVRMREKPRISKSKVCVVKVNTKLTLLSALFLETVWAFGVSVVAATAFSTSAITDRV